MTSNLSHLRNARLKLALGDIVCLSMKGSSFIIVACLVRTINNMECEFGGSNLEFFVCFVEVGLLVERRMRG